MTLDSKSEQELSQTIFQSILAPKQWHNESETPNRIPESGARKTVSYPENQAKKRLGSWVTVKYGHNLIPNMELLWDVGWHQSSPGRSNEGEILSLGWCSPELSDYNFNFYHQQWLPTESNQRIHLDKIESIGHPGEISRLYTTQEHINFTDLHLIQQN